MPLCFLCVDFVPSKMVLMEHEKAQAMLKLMKELTKGEHSGTEKGYLTFFEVEKELGFFFGEDPDKKQ